MSSKTTWDAELYEAKHNFIWKLGEGLIGLLDPRPGEHILDLGCGTGHLTGKIAAFGATVTGLDASPEMIGQARQNFPHLRFVLHNAAQLDFDAEFDAVFSNAALHWMLDADGVAAGIARALRKGGRFVAELGGKRNIALLAGAIEAVLLRYCGENLVPSRTYFPSVAEYSAVLEARGLEVRFAQLFDRPTPLEGEQGMENWIRQFNWYYFEPLPPVQRLRALDEVLAELRPTLYRDGSWFADYRRLRIVAVKV